MRLRLPVALALLAVLACPDGPSHASPPARPGDPVAAQAFQLALPTPAPAESRLTTMQGETEAAAKVIGVLLNLRDAVKETAYQGRTVIREKEGYYAWDCSGMSSWILKRAAPKARKALNKGRPVARDFYKMIDKSPLNRSRRGWRQLRDVSEARPGDVFAWLRSPASKSKVSGHVGFLVSTPKPHPQYPHLYVARIVDATSLPHGEDTRAQGSEGGFGFGTLLFVTDETGETIAYGWHGARSLEWGFMPAKVLFGRLDS